MKQVTTYVGVDAHKKDLFVAMLVGDGQTPVTWQLPNEPNAVRRLVRKLERDAPGPVRVCYEAGPCGYALQRQVATARVSCQVIAPALIPRKPGERIKTKSSRCAKVGGAISGGPADRGAAADARGRSRPRPVPGAGRCPRGSAAESSSVGQAPVASRPALRRAQLDTGTPAVDRQPGVGAARRARRGRRLSPGHRSSS